MAPNGRRKEEEHSFMARIKIERLRKGSHPSEVVISVRTADGKQETLVVDNRSLDDDTLPIGYPVGRGEGRLLVELPRETLSGSWRIWVKPDTIKEDMEALA
jgi:hypothetical protein